MGDAGSARNSTKPRGTATAPGTLPEAATSGGSRTSRNSTSPRPTRLLASSGLMRGTAASASASMDCKVFIAFSSFRRKLGSGRVQRDRLVEPFQSIVARRAVAKLGTRLLVNGLGHQDLAGLGMRLGARGGVDHRADGSEVAMRMAELAKAQLAGVDADADAELGAVRFEALLHLARRQHSLPDVVGMADGKVEDRHHGIADGLVQKSVVLPDRVGALVVECVEHGRHLRGRLRLRQLRVRPQ